MLGLVQMFTSVRMSWSFWIFNLVGRDHMGYIHARLSYTFNCLVSDWTFGWNAWFSLNVQFSLNVWFSLNVKFGLWFLSFWHAWHLLTLNDIFDYFLTQLTFFTLFDTLICFQEHVSHYLTYLTFIDTFLTLFDIFDTVCYFDTLWHFLTKSDIIWHLLRFFTIFDTFDPEYFKHFLTFQKTLFRIAKLLSELQYGNKLWKFPMWRTCVLCQSGIKIIFMHKI